MRKKIIYYILPVLVFASLMQTSCKKNQTLTTGGQITFSVDTLMFDTVFTAQASFTNGFKIYNPQSEKVVISSVRLANGSSSYFHVNVDGFSGTSVKDLTIEPHDSIYVFATVNIDPTNANEPFVIEDNFIATMNGKDYSLPLMAYGQNAYYIFDSVLNGANITWKTDKPYVIIHSAQVDSDNTLTIPAGARIYMHQDSRLVVSGKLIAVGTKTDSIIFQGDRLDRAYFGYEGYPGEWGGIYFDSYSAGNHLSYVILANCGNSALNAPLAGIELAPDMVHDVSNPQLTIDHTVVQNSIGYGLLSFNGTMHMENCLINTCGAQALALVEGGNYTIYNSTFAVYGNDKISHTDNGTVALLNYFDTSQTGYISGDMNATLKNCVVYGSLDNELFCYEKTGADYHVMLDHCLVKLKDTIPSYVDTTGLILNQDPMFKDVAKYDYHPDSGSPMTGSGIVVPLMPPADDLDGKLRSAPYSLGCYQ